MEALLYAKIAGLGEPRVGKVRQLYDLGEKVLIVATDRISAFDVVMANGIPDKGRVLNQMSAFWFKELEGICAHHLIGAEDAAIRDALGYWDEQLAGRCSLARKARPLPVECVARGYLAGSLYKEYVREGGGVHGLALPEGLVDSDRLPEPIFTPATKAQEGHDENLSFEQAADLIGRETAERVRDWSLALYSEAARRVADRGLILADTKFEFGETDDGLIWIDEALTPDSSRYWDASLYEPGGPQPSYDKQFVRDYLESSGWNKRPPGPRLPDEIVERTRDKYLQAFKRVTGAALAAGAF